MKVNMTPNPLDVVTIHASQGDTEARQWEFELHNNGELIDTSDVKEQLVFKAYKGGTEQLLPENGSTPTTSPFKGDIKYPQGLLSDQEFLYRESPTEEDGLAKITDIKGNTLVWNQLVQNGNFADGTNNWTASNGTISASNGVLTYEVTEVGTSTTSNRFYNQLPLYVNHTYLCLGEFSSTKADVRVTARRTTTSNLIFQIDMPNANTWYKASGIATMNANGSNLSITYNNASSIGEVGDKIYARNIMLFDLTQMGLDISNPSVFTSLFPLSYYAYNQGTLLSFNGNGIKTVGKNLLETATSGSVSGVTFTVNSDGSITANGTASSNGTYDLYRNTTVLPSWARAGETYALSLTNNINRFDVFSYDSSGTSKSLASISAIASKTFTIPNDAVGLLIRMFVSNGVTYDATVYPQIEFGTTPSSYEPYTSSTLSLPISTYFSNGMKSAGSVYDELTENKAITRIGSRAYQSGDESDTSVITDGTTTYYVLATPTETSFTTASLVTENAEIPLSNEDGVLIGKCTDQLSAEPGFHDAKIKLADEDGECYSNKIQLHIERSPQ